PVTRARTSTLSTALILPVNSSVSWTGSSTGWLTETSGGGSAETFAPPPHPAATAAATVRHATSIGPTVALRLLPTTVASTIASATSRGRARCRGWRPGRGSVVHAP